MRIHRHRHQKPKLNIPTFRVNEQIDNPEVRVIGDEGEQLGVIPTAKAIELARSKELDLVEVSPKAEPPVCKILDFGHFKYQKEKEVRKQKAQSHEVEIKGIRLSLRIGEHDLDIRRQQAVKFFERGDKVKAELRLRGRERAHVDMAKGVVTKFVELLKKDYPIRVEQPIQVMGGTITMVIARG